MHFTYSAKKRYPYLGITDILLEDAMIAQIAFFLHYQDRHY